MMVQGSSVYASYYAPPDLYVFLLDERIELKIHVCEALIRDSAEFAKAFSSTVPIAFDLNKREFYGLLNALYPDDSWGTSLNDLELLPIAKMMECEALSKNLKTKIGNKVLSFQASDINLAIRYYRRLKENDCLSFVKSEFSKYFGKTLLEASDCNLADSLIDVFNHCGVDQVELDNVSQEQLIRLTNWTELRTLIINENQIRSLRPLPKGLRSLNMKEGCYLSSTENHDLPSQLNTLIIRLGLWLNDTFIKTLPRNVCILSLYCEYITDLGLKSLSNTLTSLTLICIEKFTDESMEVVPRSLVHLKVSSLGLTLTSRGFKAIPRSVCSLILSGKMPEIRSNALGYLPNSLEFLELSGCINLTSDDLWALPAIGQLRVSEMACIRRPLVFLNHVTCLTIVRCIEFNNQIMFSDTLQTLELVDCYIPPEDLRLLPKSLKSLILTQCRISQEHIESIPDWIDYVELNRDILRKKGPNSSFGP